jgi:DNA recombination protein RmuC
VLLTISIVIFSLIFVSVVVFYLQKNKYEAILNAIQNEANIKITSLQNNIDIENENFQKRLEDKEKSSKALLDTKDKQLDSNNIIFSNKEEELRTCINQLSYEKSLNAKLLTKVEEQKISMDEKVKILLNSEEKLKQEFENLATKIFEENNKKFTQQNKHNMDLILTPMKQQISEFKKKVEDVYNDDVRDRSELKNELKTLKELNIKISTDAINLTNALKGQSKQQGIWGEMILEKVLESSGLRVGIEYEREKFLCNDDGKSYRPDVVVNLPENRNIIIDAKTSLRAYEQFVIANSDD